MEEKDASVYDIICANTHQLAPCGHHGRGYDVQRARPWVSKTVDVVKFALQVTCASLAAMIVAHLPVTIPGGVEEKAVEVAFTGLKAKLEGLVLCGDDNEAIEVLREEVQALQENAYKCLRTFVHDMEDTARVEINAATKKTQKARRAPPSGSEFVYFDQVVVKVQPRTGDGEAQRVLKEHEQAWRDEVRKVATG